MTHSSAVLRSFLIYLVCLPLAVFLGYQLTSPDWRTTWGTVGVVVFVLCFPLLMRFHHALLLISWNCSMAFLFLPGQPQLWFLATLLSFAISIGHRTLDQRFRFISVPEVTRPLLVLIVVVLVTAQMTGGIGLRSLGGETYGGKRYFLLLGAILGFFAMTAKRIPPGKAGLCIALFFLPGLTNIVGDFYHRSGPLTQYIYLFFQANATADAGSLGKTRYLGLTSASTAVFCFMIAKFGIRGIFDSRRPWRVILFVGASLAGCLGGFRVLVVTFMVMFTVQFFLEGLHRTRMLPVFALIAILVTAVSIPFLRHFPETVQRAFAVLPVPIDPEVRLNAQISTEWRIKMWKAVLPQVPQYLFLGKGYAFSIEDFAFAMESKKMNPIAEEQGGLALAGDYHNGPLSVIIPFGIWGVFVFLWFLVACLRVLYRNFKYGDPELKGFNTFLLTAFIARMVIFFGVYGGFYSDMQFFIGIIGLSVCLNGGVARPAAAPVPAKPAPRALTRLSPRPRVAFGARQQL